MEQKHEPHMNSTIDFKKSVSSRSSPYNWRHREHSFAKPTRKTEHQVQPVVAPSSSFINSDNNYVDFKIPDAIGGHMGNMELEYTLANANGAASIFLNTSSPYHFDRLEVRQNGNLLGDPVTSDELYLFNTVYLTDDELEKNQPYNRIDNETLELDTTNDSIGMSSSEDYVLKLRTLLNACGVVMAHVTGEIVIRIYSRNKTKWCNDANVSDLSLSEMKLLITEVGYHGGEVSFPPLDYRYYALRHEQTTLSLTSGNTTKYITNNFHDDLYSHVFVLVRTNGATLGSYTNFYSANNVYFETQGNQNLHNGVQLSNSQLERIYLDRFPNEGITFSNKHLYAICPSSDPSKDMKGQIHGTDMLPKNCKVCINADSSSGGATRQIDLYVAVPRLVRTNTAGEILLM